MRRKLTKKEEGQLEKIKQYMLKDPNWRIFGYVNVEEEGKNFLNAFHKLNKPTDFMKLLFIFVRHFKKSTEERVNAQIETLTDQRLSEYQEDGS